MCGHYLHFDCYTSYKKTLDVRKNDQIRSDFMFFWRVKFIFKEQLNHLSRSIATNEYACPLCRQIANCVLPITPMTKLSRHPREYYSHLLTAESSNFSSNSQPASPRSPDLPLDSKLTLQSSNERQPSSRKVAMTSEAYDRVLAMLKIRPYSDPESVT